jgi:hypothetical protein
MDRHPLDPVALLVGLAAVGAGALALLQQAGAFHVDGGAVAMVLCIVGAALGATVVLLSNRRRTGGSDGGFEEQPG